MKAGADDDEATIEDDADSTNAPEMRRILHEPGSAAANNVEIREAAHKLRVVGKCCDADDDHAADGIEKADHANERLAYRHAVVHLLIAGLSPTILNLPATFHQVGYAIGFAGSFGAVILYAYCMRTVVACETILCQRLRKRDGGLSYAQVLYQALAAGPPPTRWLAGYAKPLTYAVFASIWVGGNCTYVLLVAENIGSVARHLCGWQPSSRAVIAWLAVPLVVLGWTPNLRAMAAYSTLSNALNAASLLLVAYTTVQQWPPLEARTAFGDLSRLPYFLSVVFLTVNGTGLLLTLKNQMKHPQRFAATCGVVNVAFVPTAALYAVFGLLCYLKYGDRTQETVILNLADGTFAVAVQTMYALAVILFYPLVTYVTFEMLWSEMPDNKRQPGTGAGFLVKYGLMTANALLPVVLAFIIPNISLFISLIGSVCVTVDSIILPAAMEYLVHWEERSLCLRVKTTVLIGLGVALMIAGFNDSYEVFYKFYFS